MNAIRVSGFRKGVFRLTALVAGLLLCHSIASAQNCPKTLGLQNRLVGKFLVAEDRSTPGGPDGGEVNADRASQGPWETWTMIDVNCGEFGSGDDVMLKAWNGKYIHVTANGAVVTGGLATHFVLKMETGGPLRDMGVATLRVIDPHLNWFLHVFTGTAGGGRTHMVQCSAPGGFEAGAERWTIVMPEATHPEPPPESVTPTPTSGGGDAISSPMNKSGQAVDPVVHQEINPGVPTTTSIWLASDRGDAKASNSQILVYVETKIMNHKPNHFLSGTCVSKTETPSSAQLAMTGQGNLTNGSQVKFKTSIPTYITSENDGGDGLTVNRIEDNPSDLFTLVRVIVTPGPHGPSVDFAYSADPNPNALIHSGDFVALKSRNEHYWSFQRDASSSGVRHGSMNCNPDHIGPTEVFMIYASRPSARVFACPGG